MLHEVTKDQFKAAIGKLKPEHIVSASYAVTPASTKTVSESKAKEENHAESETTTTKVPIPEHVKRVHVMTVGGPMVFSAIEPFEPKFVQEVLPIAVASAGVHG